MTIEMANPLIEFNKLKKQLLHSNKFNDKNERKHIEEQMNEYRNLFISEFRKHNKNEIIKYHNLKYKG